MPLRIEELVPGDLLNKNVVEPELFNQFFPKQEMNITAYYIVHFFTQIARWVVFRKSDILDYAQRMDPKADLQMIETGLVLLLEGKWVIKTKKLGYFVSYPFKAHLANMLGEKGEN